MSSVWQNWKVSIISPPYVKFSIEFIALHFECWGQGPCKITWNLHYIMLGGKIPCSQQFVRKLHTLLCVVRFCEKKAQLSHVGFYLPCVTHQILYWLVSKYRQQTNYDNKHWHVFVRAKYIAVCPCVSFTFTFCHSIWHLLKKCHGTPWMIIEISASELYCNARYLYWWRALSFGVR